MDRPSVVHSLRCRRRKVETCRPRLICKHARLCKAALAPGDPRTSTRGSISELRSLLKVASTLLCKDGLLSFAKKVCFVQRDTYRLVCRDAASEQGHG